MRLLHHLDARRSPAVRDLAAGGTGRGRIIEIERVTELSLRLQRSAIVRRGRAVADELLGTRTALYYDHVILKPPGTEAPTAWHQDAAYTPAHVPPPAAHIWVALDDVTADHG
jgi:ectoine hydroxylase-related dioxygenase (phytanoyl-CoA dioxygenase family)